MTNAHGLIEPTQSLETLATVGTTNLERIIAVDSQSDSFSKTIPSSEGQRTLSKLLAAYFAELGYASIIDGQANLVVDIQARNRSESSPVLALMAHLDTAFGTKAESGLTQVTAWDGSKIGYAENPHLTVSSDRYPVTQQFIGEDVLHGPGQAPFGLDDKLGISEIMTLAWILKNNPNIPHGPLSLVFRPDEEIGRMEAVEGLADTLKEIGVTHGYTIDGLEPFEINVENFNAAKAWVDVPGERLSPPSEGVVKTIGMRVIAVKTHGATAKAEGHLNAVTVMARAWDAGLRDRADIVPLWMRSDITDETTADVWFQISGPDEASVSRSSDELRGILQIQLEPHAWKGARLATAEDQPRRDGPRTNALCKALQHVSNFFATPGPTPVLPEDSEGHQGYSNPHGIGPIRGDEASGTLRVSYRLRDFDPDAVAKRKAHVRTAASSCTPALMAHDADQYENMGPTLADHPELITWASEAVKALGRDPFLNPIRGGTGVDPFLARGIPVANLGTGYFAPESEKELTSRQNIARHAIWLTHLVQVVSKP